MLRSAITLIVGFIFTTAAASSVHAQSAAPPPTSSSPSAQSAASGTTPTQQKKVWTNDDVSAAHSQSDGSIASNRPAQNAGANPAAKPKNKKEAKWYQDQITKLQSQIPPLDAQIAELKSALAGDPVNEPRHYGGTRIGDWKEQLDQVQKRRQDTLDKISALEDEARHNGVSPNAIP